MNALKSSYRVVTLFSFMTVFSAATVLAAQVSPPIPLPPTNRTLTISNHFATNRVVSSPAPKLPPKVNPLVWDSTDKTENPSVDAAKAEFSFWVTNTGPEDVTITHVQPSCGCTTPTLAPLPWKLVPGTNGEVKASVDIKGKSGNLIKTLTVNSTAGFQTLTLRINVAKDPILAQAEREANMEKSKGDPQAVFKGTCTACHYNPLVNKMGEELYVAGCAICHEPGKWAESRHELAELHHKADMVPDLAKLDHEVPKAVWKAMVTSGGGPNKLMPAFATGAGGPLTDAQIESVAEYASKRFKFDPANAKKTSQAPAKK